MDARLNVTFAGQNGDLPDLVNFDASDADVRGWAAEAIRTGNVPGIAANEHVDLNDFVVDRFTANDAYPTPRLILRPKTPFGAM